MFTPQQADNKKSLLFSYTIPFFTLLFFSTFLEAQVTFAPSESNPFGLSDIARYARPALADIDNDGDLDMLVGRSKYVPAPFVYDYKYFENIGTNVSPVYSAPIPNPFGLVGLSDAIVAPCFVDLDDDSDFDLLVGNGSGNFYYYENIGDVNTPLYGPRQINPFGLVDIGSTSHPALVDLDDDGDFDIMSGELNGRFRFFLNIGSPSQPLFGSVQTNPFGLTTLTASYSTPSFADFDEDGDQDMIAGDYFGNYNYYENIGDSSSALFASSLVNPFSIQAIQANGIRTSPLFVDLDGDNDLDIMSGRDQNDSIDFHYFQNITGPVEIRLIGNNREIFDGDTAVALNNNTNFGWVHSSSTRQYRIENKGGFDLVLNSPIAISGANASDFTIVESPDTVIPPGGITHFTLSCAPTALGLREATISISNSDTDESVFTFAVEAKGAINHKLRVQDCGIEGVDPLSKFLFYNVDPSASNYKINIDDSLEIVNGNINSFNVNQIPNVQYNTTYRIAIAAFVDGEWADYGDACTIKTMKIEDLQTSMYGGYCGHQNLDPLGGRLRFTPRADAMEYEVLVRKGSDTIKVISTTDNLFFVSDLTVSGGYTAEYNTTYNAQIRIKVNGMWSDYGPICNFSTIDISNITTSLYGGYCGHLDLDPLGGRLLFTYRADATEYEILVKKQGDTIGIVPSIDNSFFVSELSEIDGYTAEYNTTYSAEIRMKINGSWTNYGNACNFSTIKIADLQTSLYGGYCGHIDLSPLSGQLLFSSRADAMEYEVLVKKGPDTVGIISTIDNVFFVSELTVPGGYTAEYNTTYTAQVRMKVDSLWSNYGPLCNFSTEAAPQLRKKLSLQNKAESLEEVEFNIYPNPTSQSAISIQYKQESTIQRIQLLVVDIRGRVIVNKEFYEASNTFQTQLNEVESFEKGTYLVKLIAGGQVEVKRLIVS